MPRTAPCSERCSAIVWGSRKSIRCRPLGHHQRVRPVGGEVQVVGVRHRDGLAGPPGARVDGDQVVAEVVVDPERLHVPAGDDVLRLAAGRVAGHHLVGAGVDDLQRVREGVGHVDQRPGGRGPAPCSWPAPVVRRRRWPGWAGREAGGGARWCRRPEPWRTSTGAGASVARPGARACTRSARRPTAAARHRAGPPRPCGSGRRCRGRCPRRRVAGHAGPLIRSVTVTARRPRWARPSRIAGSAATVPGCPRCRLTIDPLTASRCTRLDDQGRARVGVVQRVDVVGQAPVVARGGSGAGGSCRCCAGCRWAGTTTPAAGQRGQQRRGPADLAARLGAASAGASAGGSRCGCPGRARRRGSPEPAPGSPSSQDPTASTVRPAECSAAIRSTFRVSAGSPAPWKVSATAGRVRGPWSRSAAGDPVAGAVGGTGEVLDGVVAPGTGEDVVPGGGVEGVADPAVEGPLAVPAGRPSSGEQALAVTRWR